MDLFVYTCARLNRYPRTRCGGIYIYIYVKNVFNIYIYIYVLKKYVCAMFVLAVVVLFFVCLLILYFCVLLLIVILLCGLFYLLFIVVMCCVVFLYFVYLFFICLLVGMGTTPKVATAPFRTAGNAQGNPSLRQPLPERGVPPNGMFHPWARWDKDLAHAIRIRAW